ncbi:hypothetical protein [Listeria booriae]|uniref:Uncharacterized protein n=2 Tax=Listeria booriae TaxID=1552123 RepID=A0A841Y464_9LIST|nr:hypothetical protein [Listeria booriae]MBC1318427.1 hypothetical protein [Listeria booriae]
MAKTEQVGNTSNIHLRGMLLDVLELAFPPEEIGTDKLSQFYLELHQKEMAKKHGDYNLDTHLIRLFNLSRPYKHIIISGLHELAHHIEATLHGETKHQERFYGYLHQLMLTAMSMEIITKMDAIDEQANPDLDKLEKFFGKIAYWQFNKIPYKQNKCHIRILRAYEWRDILKGFGYSYLTLEQVWMKEFEIANQQVEVDALMALGIPKNNIVIQSATEIEADFFYYLVIRNAYDHREYLRSIGYRYGGYGKGDRNWVKKIMARDLAAEKELVANLMGVAAKVMR